MRRFRRRDSRKIRDLARLLAALEQSASATRPRPARGLRTYVGLLR